MREFKTASLHLAAWLVATQKLKFLRTEPRPNRPAQKLFCFEDPESIALVLQHEFTTSDPPCGVKSFINSVAQLRDELNSEVHHVPPTR